MKQQGLRCWLQMQSTPAIPSELRRQCKRQSVFDGPGKSATASTRPPVNTPPINGVRHHAAPLVVLKVAAPAFEEVVQAFNHQR